MPHGGQGDNLLFKEGDMAKRSMLPSFLGDGAGLTVAHGVVV